jgi:excisionase family DNA binding protein
MVSKTRIDKGRQTAQRIPNPPRQRLYDVKSAAKYLGRPVWGVRELIWSGRLPVVKDGRKQYLDLYDMDKYIEQNKVTVI